MAQAAQHEIISQEIELSKKIKSKRFYFKKRKNLVLKSFHHSAQFTNYS